MKPGIFIRIFFLSLIMLSNLLFSADNMPGKSATGKIIIKEVPFQLDNQGKKVKSYKVMVYDKNGNLMPNGVSGVKGEYFDYIVVNKTSVPTTLHWHGLIVPNNQDGVPGVTQKLIPPGKSKHYRFQFVQAGTYWLHSHEKLQEQLQMSAPFIIYESEEQKKQNEVVIFLKDFTYQSPEKLLKALQNTKMNMDENKSSEGPDLNDIKYDAFLANKKTLTAPDVLTFKPGETVRLRIINGSAATNYHVDMGKLNSKLIAVDGENITPVTQSVYPIGIGNRLDIMVKLPNSKGAYPILAKAEGRNLQAGIIIKTPNAITPKISSKLDKETDRVAFYELEKRLKALNPLPKKKVDISLNYDLTGSMSGYVWKINNEIWPNITPKEIKEGDRVELVFTNKNAMSHPMHFHGHVFQVTEIDGTKIKDGARRDTILVQPKSTVKVVFDADNPGIWVTHCHNLYHLNAGMMTTIEFKNYPKPDFYLKTINKK